MSWRPDPFEYLEYRAYLKAVYEAAHAAGATGYSYRGLAMRAGYSSPNFVKLVIDGKRNLGVGSIERVARALNLDDDEAAYFHELVLFDQATTPTERQEAYDRMSAMARFRRARRINGSLYAYLEFWYLPAIRELAARADFRADPAWIAGMLCPAITEAEARDALDTLFGLGLLVRDPSGCVGRGEPTLTTGHQAHHHNVVGFHQQMLSRASDALTTVPSAQREISGTTVCVSLETAQRIKAELQQTRERLLELCDRDQAAEVVYQLGFQLFPLSRAQEPDP